MKKPAWMSMTSTIWPIPTGVRPALPPPWTFYFPPPPHRARILLLDFFSGCTLLQPACSLGSGHPPIPPQNASYTSWGSLLPLIETAGRIVTVPGLHDNAPHFPVLAIPAPLTICFSAHLSSDSYPGYQRAEAEKVGPREKLLPTPTARALVDTRESW